MNMNHMEMKDEDHVRRIYQDFFEKVSNFKALQADNPSAIAQYFNGKLKADIPQACMIELLHIEAIRYGLSLGILIAPIDVIMRLGAKTQGDAFLNENAGMNNKQLRGLIDSIIQLVGVLCLNFEAGQLQGDYRQDRVINTALELHRLGRKLEKK